MSSFVPTLLAFVHVGAQELTSFVLADCYSAFRDNEANSSVSVHVYVSKADLKSGKPTFTADISQGSLVWRHFSEKPPVFETSWNSGHVSHFSFDYRVKSMPSLDSLMKSSKTRMNALEDAVKLALNGDQLKSHLKIGLVETMLKLMTRHFKNALEPIELNDLVDQLWCTIASKLRILNAFFELKPSLEAEMWALLTLNAEKGTPNFKLPFTILKALTTLQSNAEGLAQVVQTFCGICASIATSVASQRLLPHVAGLLIYYDVKYVPYIVKKTKLLDFLNSALQAIASATENPDNALSSFTEPLYSVVTFIGLEHRDTLVEKGILASIQSIIQSPSFTSVNRHLEAVKLLQTFKIGTEQPNSPQKEEQHKPSDSKDQEKEEKSQVFSQPQNSISFLADYALNSDTNNHERYKTLTRINDTLSSPSLVDTIDAKNRLKICTLVYKSLEQHESLPQATETILSILSSINPSFSEQIEAGMVQTYVFLLKMLCSKVFALSEERTSTIGEIEEKDNPSILVDTIDYYTSEEELRQSSRPAVINRKKKEKFEKILHTSTSVSEIPFFIINPLFKSMIDYFALNCCEKASRKTRNGTIDVFLDSCYNFMPLYPSYDHKPIEMDSFKSIVIENDIFGALETVLPVLFDCEKFRPHLVFWLSLARIEPSFKELVIPVSKAIVTRFALVKTGAIDWRGALAVDIDLATLHLRFQLESLLQRLEIQKHKYDTSIDWRDSKYFEKERKKENKKEGQTQKDNFSFSDVDWKRLDALLRSKFLWKLLNDGKHQLGPQDVREQLERQNYENFSNVRKLVPVDLSRYVLEVIMNLLPVRDIRAIKTSIALFYGISVGHWTPSFFFVLLLRIARSKDIVDRIWLEDRKIPRDSITDYPLKITIPQKHFYEKQRKHVSTHPLAPSHMRRFKYPLAEAILYFSTCARLWISMDWLEHKKVPVSEIEEIEEFMAFTATAALYTGAKNDENRPEKSKRDEKAEKDNDMEGEEENIADEKEKSESIITIDSNKISNTQMELLLDFVKVFSELADDKKRGSDKNETFRKGWFKHRQLLRFISHAPSSTAVGSICSMQITSISYALSLIDSDPANETSSNEKESTSENASSSSQTTSKESNSDENVLWRPVVAALRTPSPALSLLESRLEGMMKSSENEAPILPESIEMFAKYLNMFWQYAREEYISNRALDGRLAWIWKITRLLQYVHFYADPYHGEPRAFRSLMYRQREPDLGSLYEDSMLYRFGRQPTHNFRPMATAASEACASKEHENKKYYAYVFNSDDVYGVPGLRHRRDYGPKQISINADWDWFGRMRTLKTLLDVLIDCIELIPLDELLPVVIDTEKVFPRDQQTRLINAFLYPNLLPPKDSKETLHDHEEWRRSVNYHNGCAITAEFIVGAVEAIQNLSIYPCVTINKRAMNWLLDYYWPNLIPKSQFDRDIAHLPNDGNLVALAENRNIQTALSTRHCLLWASTHVSPQVHLQYLMHYNDPLLMARFWRVLGKMELLSASAFPPADTAMAMPITAPAMFLIANANIRHYFKNVKEILEDALEWEKKNIVKYSTNDVQPISSATKSTSYLAKEKKIADRAAKEAAIDQQLGYVRYPYGAPPGNVSDSDIESYSEEYDHGDNNNRPVLMLRPLQSKQLDFELPTPTARSNGNISDSDLDNNVDTMMVWSDLRELDWFTSTEYQQGSILHTKQKRISPSDHYSFTERDYSKLRSKSDAVELRPFLNMLDHVEESDGDPKSKKSISSLFRTSIPSDEDERRKTISTRAKKYIAAFTSAIKECMEFLVHPSIDAPLETVWVPEWLAGRLLMPEPWAWRSVDQSLSNLSSLMMVGGVQIAPLYSTTLTLNLLSKWYASERLKALEERIKATMGTEKENVFHAGARAFVLSDVPLHRDTPSSSFAASSSKPDKSRKKDSKTDLNSSAWTQKPEPKSPSVYPYRTATTPEELDNAKKPALELLHSEEMLNFAWNVLSNASRFPSTAISVNTHASLTLASLIEIETAQTGGKGENRFSPSHALWRSSFAPSFTTWASQLPEDIKWSIKSQEKDDEANEKKKEKRKKKSSSKLEEEESNHPQSDINMEKISTSIVEELIQRIGDTSNDFRKKQRKLSKLGSFRGGIPNNRTLYNFYLLKESSKYKAQMISMMDEISELLNILVDLYGASSDSFNIVKILFGREKLECYETINMRTKDFLVAAQKVKQCERPHSSDLPPLQRLVLLDFLHLSKPIGYRARVGMPESVETRFLNSFHNLLMCLVNTPEVARYFFITPIWNAECTEFAQSTASVIRTQLPFRISTLLAMDGGFETYKHAQGTTNNKHNASSSDSPTENIDTRVKRSEKIENFASEILQRSLDPTLGAFSFAILGQMALFSIISHFTKDAMEIVKQKLPVHGASPQLISGIFLGFWLDTLGSRTIDFSAPFTPWQHSWMAASIFLELCQKPRLSTVSPSGESVAIASLKAGSSQSKKKNDTEDYNLESFVVPRTLPRFAPATQQVNLQGDIIDDSAPKETRQNTSSPQEVFKICDSPALYIGGVDDSKPTKEEASSRLYLKNAFEQLHRMIEGETAMAILVSRLYMGSATTEDLGALLSCEVNVYEGKKPKENRSEKSVRQLEVIEKEPPPLNAGWVGVARNEAIKLWYMRRERLMPTPGFVLLVNTLKKVAGLPQSALQGWLASYLSPAPQVLPNLEWPFKSSGMSFAMANEWSDMVLNHPKHSAAVAIDAEKNHPRDDTTLLKSLSYELEITQPHCCLIPYNRVVNSWHHSLGIKLDAPHREGGREEDEKVSKSGSIFRLQLQVRTIFGTSDGMRSKATFLPQFRIGWATKEAIHRINAHPLYSVGDVPGSFALASHEGGLFSEGKFLPFPLFKGSKVLFTRCLRVNMVADAAARKLYFFGPHTATLSHLTKPEYEKSVLEHSYCIPLPKDFNPGSEPLYPVISTHSLLFYRLVRYSEPAIFCDTGLEAAWSALDFTG